MRSSAAFPHRLAMYDYARGNCVRESFLRELIDTIAAMRLTGLAVYMEDLAMFLKPSEFAGSIHLDGWRRLDAHARDRGLFLLPMLNLYGHCEQTVAHPEFAPLRDGYGTLDYDHPRTKPTLQRALDVVVETFQAPLLHIGFDEVWGIGRRRERRTGRPVHVPGMFARHLTWACAQVRQRGRRPMFWADVPSVYYPEMIPDLPRDLIAADWFYRPEPEYPSFRRWTRHGFELWIAPTVGFGERAWPDSGGWEEHTHRVLGAGREAGARGVIFTGWEHGMFNFRHRLPFLAWQARLARGGADARLPLVRGMIDWLHPTLGRRAGRYVRASLALGFLERLLPSELRYGTRDVPGLRRDWYRANPFAAQSFAHARRILRDVRTVANRHPDLSLAHERLSILWNALHPRRVDSKALARRARSTENAIRREWIAERTAGSFLRMAKPALKSFRAELASMHGRTPLYDPSCALAYRDRCAGLPSTLVGAVQLHAWHTSSALHCRFECVQRRRPRGVEQSVDYLLTRDDLVAMCLDVRGRGEGYLWIEGNPAGTVFCQVHDSQNRNSEWHPLAGRKNWGRAFRLRGVWGIEFVIPWKELGIARPRPGAEMGLTFERRHAFGEKPAERWGGLGRMSRDHPRCLSRLVFL